MLLLKDDNKVISINADRPSDIKFERIYCPDGLENPVLQFALVVNLEQELNIIFDSFHKKARYKIRRCINGDKPVVNFDFSPSIYLIETFIEYYKDFVRDKNSEALNGTTSELLSKLLKFQSLDCLAISSAYSDNYPDNKVFHVYILDKPVKNVRLLCSVSSFRHSDSNVKSVIGRLNRLLHYRDIEQFKNSGYLLYDFGGVDLNAYSEETANVADFKMQLCDKVLKYYYAENRSLTPKRGGGKLLSKLQQAFKSIKRKKYIAIIYNTATYEIAKEIVNQLASEFNFYLYSTSQYSRKFRKSFDFVHDLTESYEKCVYYKELAFVPYKYFYAKNRSGEITICNQKDEIFASENAENLCKYFNNYDIYVASTSDKILEALACGCFCIALKNEVSEKLIKDKINGYVINSEDDLPNALDWCRQNLKNVRENARLNARDIEQRYSYFVVADKYRNFYNSVKI